jgi:multidrug efflux pump subunit AcrA (membrane-fusion protein)
MSTANPHPAASPDPLDRPSGLLPLDPPPRALRWAGGWLLAVAAAAGIFAVTFRIPETVVAPFEIVAAEGSDPLQAPIAGELVAVRVREGQRVDAGAELFRIRSDEIRNAQSRRLQLLEDQRALGERSRRLDEAHAGELAIKDAEIVQAERELGFRDTHLKTIRDLLRRASRLAVEGLISEVELLRHQLDEAESEKDRLLAEKQIQQVQLQRRERVMLRERQRNDEQAEAEKLRLQLTALDGQLANSSGDVKSVRAPATGVITHLVHGSPGSVVASGVVLGEMARADARPVARLLLPEAGVPRVAAGQDVRLFLSAFPYQRHGTVAATLGFISPSAVPGAGLPGFIGMADLKPRGDSGLEVRIGMKGEARILVGRRTLLERALEPIRGAKVRLLPE